MRRNPTNTDQLGVFLVHDRTMMREMIASQMALSSRFRVDSAVTSTRAMQCSGDAIRSQIALVIPQCSRSDSVRYDDLICKLSTHCPHTKIIVSAEDESVILSCLESGATGYVEADLSWEKFERRLQDVYEGRQHCAPKILATLLKRIRDRSGRQHLLPRNDASNLSSREMEVAALMACGRTNKEISTELGVTLSTVKNHVHSVLQKTGVRRRHEILGRTF